MATTDTRPGFRLPWNSDRADAEANGTEPAEAAQATETEAVAQPATDVPTPEASAETDAPATEAAAEATAPVTGTAEAEPAAPEPSIVSEAAPAEAPKAAAKASGKKPNKFLADLTRAMQATAETERNETLERFSAEAKAAIEKVHTAAADETTELRRVADDDVAGIRDWSKAEIARIREETENRISGRKSELERELELHGGTIEGRIDRINAKVTSFEAEVADFYERLFAEEDPTRFAAMAEQLPEPPSLDLPGADDAVMIGVPAAVAVEAVPAEPVVEAVAEPSEPEIVEAPVETVETVEATAEVVEAPQSEAPDETGTNESHDAVEAAAADGGDVEAAPADDPRLAALEQSPSFEAAEAEAALTVADAATSEAPEEIPTIADEVLAARLAGLVPEEGAESPIQTTKVVVTGLVSVASIAGFKRHLGRLQGVTTVGVSSGPDGEFVFSVHHVATMDLAAGIAGLPGFESRITNQGEGSIEVAARDPEAHD